MPKADKQASTATATAKPAMVKPFRSGRRIRFRKASHSMINESAVERLGCPPGWPRPAGSTNFGLLQPRPRPKREPQLEGQQYPVPVDMGRRRACPQTTEATWSFAE